MELKSILGITKKKKKIKFPIKITNFISIDILKYLMIRNNLLHEYL